ncbi:GldG family protein [Magnetofaba australis]|uniref:Putative ABC transporter n=1 Tax=Magnetofaba australis IT-1 TaxID=1434232 RepID=A0A1Y2K692_9PROT|nr:GldG family protein [Magnetofaba australis]OSM05040.1 putative ABC transporter [Magnetofaba australis IT-1]
MEMNQTYRRSQRAQLLTLLAIGVALLTLIGVAVKRYDVQWDWTANKQHSLAEQSIKAVQGFEEGLTATVYAQESSNEAAVAKEELEKYQLHNAKLRIVIVDPELRPDLVKADGVTKLGTVVLRAGDKQEKVEILSEEELTNALVRMGKEKRKTVRFVTGHGEHVLDKGDRSAYSQVIAVLKAEGYDVGVIRLVEQEKIPDDVDVLIIPGPKSDLLEPEIARLTTWWNENKQARLMTLLDPEGDGGLSALLEPYGVKLLEGTLVEPRMARTPFAIPPAEVDENHPIAPKLTQIPVFYTARGLALDSEIPTGATWTRSRLLASSESSWLESGNLDGESISFQQTDGDKRGPIVMASAVADGDKRLVVTADADFPSDQLMGYPGNADLFLNMIRWLASEENSIAIKPKPVLDAGMQLQGGDLILLMVLLLGVVPVSLAGAGVAIWMRRRRR